MISMMRFAYRGVGLGLLSAGLALAQGSGSISGRVVSEQGLLLQAKVTLTFASARGIRRRRGGCPRGRMGRSPSRDWLPGRMLCARRFRLPKRRRRIRLTWIRACGDRGRRRLPWRRGSRLAGSCLRR